MSNQTEKTLWALQELATTTDILIKALIANDLVKGHEAVSILLMQGVDLLGPDSVAMQQFFPVWEAIKAHIDRSDGSRALGQAQTWKTQLNDVISIVKQSV